MKISPRFSYYLNYLVALSALAIVSTFTYGYFVIQPYSGFTLAGDVITSIQSPAYKKLEVNEQLIQVGPILMRDFLARHDLTLLQGVKPGEKVFLKVKGINGQEREVTNYVYPGPSGEGVIVRLIAGHWWIAYVFWLLGTNLVLNPKNPPYKGRMTAFFYITAILLSAGNLAFWKVWYGENFTTILHWLCVIVYWELHLNFPRPLSRPRFLRISLGVIYLGSVTCAILEFFGQLPLFFHNIAYPIALIGSAIILIARIVTQKDQRRNMSFLLGGLTLPTLTLTYCAIAIKLYPDSPLPIAPFASGVFALMFVPGIYLTIANYYQGDGFFSTRINKAISFSFFTTFLALSAATIAHLISTGPLKFEITEQAALLSLLLTLIMTGLAVYAFSNFQGAVERYLLRTPVPSENFISVYTNKITQVAGLTELKTVIQEELLPSINIQQSALLISEEGQLRPICYKGISLLQLPESLETEWLLQQAGFYRPPTGDSSSLAWVRLVWPLALDKTILGFWLLGAHGTDDIYSEKELEALQVISSTTAVTLSHLLQTENFRRLSQENIDREEERSRYLARNIHDMGLTELRNLKMRFSKFDLPPELFIEWDRINDTLRMLQENLRPILLTHQGLQGALEELIDKGQLTAPEIEFTSELEGENPRYEERVEEHLYRIAQQAVANAIKHSQPSQIAIRGYLKSAGLHLSIEDNGKGFDIVEQPNLAKLISKKNFGIAGIYERAQIIGAHIKFKSELGIGTKVEILWENKTLKV